jgi:type I restriction enzyme S subunit
MSCEWTKQALGDVCVKIGSGATPRGGKAAYVEAGTALIRSQNVLNSKFRWDGLARITDDAAAKLASVEVKVGDVLLNITGDSVARACLAPLDILPARVNQHVAILRPAQDLDSRFLMYWLISGPTQSLLLRLAASGATRNALTKGMIEGLTLSLPPLDAQRRIADVLAAFDRKVAANASFCERLAEVAISATRNRLRGVPTEKRPLGEILSLHRRKSTATNRPYLGLDQMPRASAVLGNWRPEGEDGRSVSYDFERGDILFGKLRPYFRKAGIAPLDGRCSGEILVLRPAAQEHYALGVAAVTDERFIQHCVGVSSGTRMPRAEWKDAQGWMCDVPLDPDDVRDLSDLNRVAFSLVAQLVQESQLLLSVRDALLPRLLTGALSVDVDYGSSADMGSAN